MMGRGREASVVVLGIGPSTTMKTMVNIRSVTKLISYKKILFPLKYSISLLSIYIYIQKVTTN